MMLLRDRLNEFQLDWAQAPLRSELIPFSGIKGKKVLLIGDPGQLFDPIAWSFEAWNDGRNAGVHIAGAVFDKEAECLKTITNYTEGEFLPEDADYMILTGFGCREIPSSVEEALSYMGSFRKLLQLIGTFSCERVLLLSDGRVYGRLSHGFAASEYEAGATDTCEKGFEAQYFLQSIESIFITYAKELGFSYNILRTALIYGPCIPMMDHAVCVLAKKTAAGEPFALSLSKEKSSYISIHDALTAIQFVLAKCPKNKIFNASGLSSTVSEGELAILLYNNFPEKCCVTMTGNEGKLQEKEDSGECRKEDLVSSDMKYQGIWLNTQLLEHYGFAPKVSLEDGLVILVKSLQNTGEVFIFDNTYLGKLEKVQKILLGYLLEIDRICKKHNIKYFLAGGTLLGAIRHHGFIPWDDDADVMMLREDYEKFQKVVQQELPDNIFMQVPSTEKGNYNPFTKLRINNTMFATEFTGHFMDMHNGIFFDVLSHDKTGQHKWSQKLHLMATMLTRSIVFNKWGDTDIKGGGAHPVICKIVDRVKYLIPMRFALWAQNRSLEFFKNRKTEYLYDGMGRNLKRGSFPAKWLEEAVYVDFEGYQFPVPKEYDKYLTYLYGDYMQMIPVSQRRTSHSIVVMDLGEYSGYKLEKGRGDTPERKDDSCFQ